MRKLYWLFILLTIVFSGCSDDKSLYLEDLRCENLLNPIAIDSTQPHFSWKVKSDREATNQTHYEIQVATDEQKLLKDQPDVWNSGKVESDASVMVPYAGQPLQPRNLLYWKVRVWDNHGRVTPWSDVQRFGIGILSAQDWKGEFIGLKDCGSPQLRKKFEVADTTSTRLLHVASLGYHEVYLNGQKVSKDVLAPSVSQLDKRANSATYDLTPYIRQGENDLMLWLGTGWYREHTFKAVHQGPLVKAQLDVIAQGKATTELTSDATWMARPSEYSDASNGWWYPHQFGGECVDGTRALSNFDSSTLDEQAWSKAWVAEVPNLKISPQMCEPNRIIETIQPEEIKQVKDSVWIVKMPKALNGWVEIAFPALPDSLRVTIEYSDWHDGKGNFKAQEEWDDGKHSSHYEDAYITSSKGGVFRNKFNHHAFQYIRLSNLPKAPEKLTAFLVGTDFKDASSFESSDTDLNAIYSMIKYTFRPLAFSGYIVDCPQIERMGYGGDGNASCRSFQTLYDGAPLYQNWMKMWADCVREDGGMPHCVPNPYPAGGGPYWCGFIITASWETYLNYGDKRLLERYYPVMQQWLGYVDKYTVDGLLKRWPDTDYRNWYLGDWLAPEKLVDYRNLESVDLVSNCFVSYCYDVMSQMATLLGKPSDAKLYQAKEKALKELVHHTFYKEETGSYASGTQIDLIYPMLVDIAKGQVTERVRQQLFDYTRQHLNGHIGVGLVGVTILTDWATKAGEVDFLYQMLKKSDYPGYMHMINQGATTTWEYWEGHRSKIHNCYNGIGSWFIQALGGITPTLDAPGYKQVLIRPQLPEGLEWVNVSKETPYGKVRSSWRVEADRIVFEVSVPTNSSASFILPIHSEECQLNGRSINVEQDTLTLESGDHQIVIARP